MLFRSVNEAKVVPITEVSADDDTRNKTGIKELDRVLGGAKKYTLQLALGNIQNMFGNPNQQCAAALIAILPLLIVYIVFQRFFIEGIAVGGGKE